MKKLTALLLAVLMMALPVLGLAQSPDEMLNAALESGRPGAGKVTFEGGVIPVDDADIATAVKDLLDALGFTLAWQEEEGASQVDFAFQISGNDALTFAYAGKDGENYIKSNLLGEDVMAFNEAEGKVILDRLIDLGVEAEMFSRTEAAEMKKALEEAIAQMNVEMNEINLEDLDLTPFVTVGLNLASKVQTGEVTAQPKNCDTAASVITVKFTGEDLKQIGSALCTVLRSSKDLMAFMDTLAVSVEMESGEAMVNEIEKSFHEIYGSIVGEVPVEMYLDEAGELVYATTAFVMQPEEGTQLNTEMSYARLTTNAAQNHSAVMTIKDQENTGVNLSVNASISPELNNIQVGMSFIENGVSEELMNVAVLQEKAYGELKSECDTDVIVNVIDGAETMSFKVEVEEEAEKIGEQDVKYNAEIEVYLQNFEEELLTVKVEEVTGTAAPSIVSASAVRPGAVTEEEFNELAGDVLMNAQTALFGMLGYLPDSVMALLFAQ